MFIWKRSAEALLGLLAVALLGSFTPSGAENAAPNTSRQFGRAGTVVNANDPCILYTYDLNGNRTAQTIAVSGGPLSPTWGTGAWGCFSWTP